MRSCFKWCFITLCSIHVTLLTLSTGYADAEDDHDFELRAEPLTVPIGGVAKLTWTAHGSAAFLSGIGQVPLSGSLEVAPQESTTYTLVVDNNGKILVRSTKVGIEGARDIPVGPDFGKFTAAVSGQESALGYVQFLGFVFKTLQDRMKFTVHGDFLPGRPFDVLYTERVPKPELVRPSDNGIRERQIAYAVVVYNRNEDANPPCGFEVSVLIQYRLFGESKWHPEPSESVLMREQSDALKQVLETASAK
jgi:hypothetical protein